MSPSSYTLPVLLLQSCSTHRPAANDAGQRRQTAAVTAWLDNASLSTPPHQWQDTRYQGFSAEFLSDFVCGMIAGGGGGIRCQVWLKRKPVASIGSDNSTEVFCRNWKQCSCEVQPYLNILYIKEVQAEPILPICRLRKLRKSPETPGSPLLPKIFSFKFRFRVWPEVMKTWIIIHFNAVRCYPLYVKSVKSCDVNII